MQQQPRKSSLFMDMDEDQRNQVSFFSPEARAQRSGYPTVAATSERSDIGNGLRSIAPWFVGLFAYLLSYGLLLTFGLLALGVLMLGFATFGTATTTYSGTSTGTSALDTLSQARTAIRAIAFGAAFLALWPGWFGASVARRHFEATR